jgi:hypothetical protein
LLPGFGFLIGGAPRDEQWPVRRHFGRSIQIRFDRAPDQNVSWRPSFFSRKPLIKSCPPVNGTHAEMGVGKHCIIHGREIKYVSACGQGIGHLKRI